MSRKTKTVTTQTEEITDIRCDICDASLRVDLSEGGDMAGYYGLIGACVRRGWGAATGDGPDVRIDVCETCLTEKLGWRPPEAGAWEDQEVACS